MDELCDRIFEVVVVCVSRMMIWFFEGERSQICIRAVDLAAETFSDVLAWVVLKQFRILNARAMAFLACHFPPPVLPDSPSH